MTICRVKHNKNNPYLTINTTIVSDERISWKAKGLWLYAFSRPDDWQFYVSDLIKRSVDGKESVASGLKELEKHGYLIRNIARKKDGTIEGYHWVFLEVPEDQEEEFKKCYRKRGFPSAGKTLRRLTPPTENPPLLSNEAQPNNHRKENKKKKGAAAAGAPSPTAEAAERCCSLLLENIRKEDPGFKPQAFEKWKVEVEKLIRIDERSEELVTEVINWIQNDWWSQNVLSGESLKRNFNKILFKMNKEKKSPEKQVEIEESKKMDRIEENKKYAQQEHKKNPCPKITLGDACVYISEGRGRRPLAYSEHGFKEQFDNACRKLKD